jgi:hypothetical protein
VDGIVTETEEGKHMKEESQGDDDDDDDIFIIRGEKVKPILQSETGALFTLDTKSFSFISYCTKWTVGGNRA